MGGPRGGDAMSNKYYAPQLSAIFASAGNIMFVREPEGTFITVEGEGIGTGRRMPMPTIPSAEEVAAECASLAWVLDLRECERTVPANSSRSGLPD